MIENNLINLIWGIILTSATLKVWVGQIIIVLSPKLAEKINIIESDMDKNYYLDLQVSAVWDAIVLWTLPSAGILLILNNFYWIYFGLIGGGMYIYFVGRTIASNLELYHNKIKIRKSKKVKVKLLILIFWGVIAIVTIILALVELSL